MIDPRAPLWARLKIKRKIIGWMVAGGGLAALAALAITAGPRSPSPYSAAVPASSPSIAASAPAPSYDPEERRFLAALSAEDREGAQDAELLASGWTICRGDSAGYGETSQSSMFDIILGPPTVEVLRDYGDEPIYQAAINHLCPQYKAMQTKARKQAEGKFEDGEWEVGRDVRPGTYRTDGGVTGCYWERSTRGGATIANDFVTNAPGGVRVTIAATDGGFTSQNCGTWLRVR